MTNRSWSDVITRAVRTGLDLLGRRTPTSPSSAPPAPPAPTSTTRTTGTTPPPAGGYPGDFAGEPAFAYSPTPDGHPDPGEVVWAWVPYEEDATQGKDRPALVVGHDGRWLLALPLTSKNHHRDAAQEAAAGRFWHDIGSGAWDPDRRPSEVRLDRVVRLDPARVRREGAALDRAVYDSVVAAAKALGPDR